ncbi:MAG: VCBS repeat-containing protein, partial [Candidatus Omnitrophica bacterium]|nr:VCBS repeat-containing protein [Candidatus Omnitrophota bacterium]
MKRFLRDIVCVAFVLILWQIQTVNASSGSSSSKSSSNSTSSFSQGTYPTTSNPSSEDPNKHTSAAISPRSTSSTSSGVVSSGVGANIQATSVQVEPFTGSANLSIPIAVPPGRAGIQPNIALTYSSSNHQLGMAGIGWSLDLGSIQRSIKKGVPTYNDSTDIFTMFQGSSQDLVADPSGGGLYHPEVEGSFAKVQYISNSWLVTDKKGIKYYFGNTDDSRQYDSVNTSHIFRWALNRVEDLNGNYMTITYMKDAGQLYPQTIAYTGNSQQGLTPYAKVFVNYVSNTVPTTSYISGFGVSTAKRMDSIIISVNSNNQSSYKLSYQQSPTSQRDLLQSVTQLASDSIAYLPPITFTYRTNHGSWSKDQLQWHIPDGDFVTSNQDQGRRLLDLNGDGLTDFVLSRHDPKESVDRQWLSETFLNSKSGFSTTPNWWPIPIGYFIYGNTSSSWDDGRRLVDLTGDGLPEEIAAANWDPNNAYYGNFKDADQFMYKDQVNPSWVQSSNWNLPQGYFVYGNTIDGGIRFSDLNGDGLNDLSIALGTINGMYWTGPFTVNSQMNTYLNTGSGWKQDGRWNVPSGNYYTTSSGDGGVRLSDLNGDGLTDLIIARDGSKATYINNGSGWMRDDAWNIPDGDFTTGGKDQGRILVDINGDGLPDLVIANNGYHAVYINTGHGWKRDDSFNISDGDFVDANGQYQGRELGDLDGDGVVDLCIAKDGYKAAYLNLTGVSDILISIANGLGASTTIDYAPSTNYNNYYPNNTSKLAFVFQVVSKTTTNDGRGNSYITNYSYQGGYFDAPTREFRGFNYVKVIDANGNYSATTFLQDHWLKGHPSQEDKYDSNDNLYSRSVNQWQTQDIVTNTTTNQVSKFAFVSRTDNYLYDGSSTAKRTAQEMTYGENPQYGDPTLTINYGEVDAVTGSDIATDKLTSTVSYVNNTSNWLLGLPSQTTVKDINGNVVNQTSFYYDGSSTLTATPTLGRLTLKSNWLGSTTQGDPQTRYSYDIYGNLLTTTDPVGNTTTITYDNDVHLFPVQVKNALNQTSQTSYYGVDGTAFSDGTGLRGLWGQTKSVTDANNQTAYSSYDVLGRPSFSVSPLDSVALPTSSMTYNIQPTYTAITTQARVESGSTPTISSVTYYDGLGRAIESKSL